MSLLRHPETGHLVGIEQAPAPKVVAADPAYPTWVVPHESHVTRTKIGDGPEVVSVPNFSGMHVNRVNGEVTVLVADEEEAKIASGEYKAPEAPTVVITADDATKATVHAEVEAAKAAQTAAIAKLAAAEQAKLEADEAAIRATQKAELEARNREATEKLAAESRRRIAESIGAPVVEAASPPSSPPDVVTNPPPSTPPVPPTSP